MNGRLLTAGWPGWRVPGRSALAASLDPGLVLTAGRAGAFLATFLIPVILARLLDPAGFGTYKQVFLLHATLYAIVQLGMAESLFYFLPLRPRLGGRLVINASLFLVALGLMTAFGLVAGAESLGRWLRNPDLHRYLPLVAIFLVLTLASAALEMTLVARGRHLGAALSYALSDLVKAGCLIVPALLFGGLSALLAGAVLFAALRLAAWLFVVRREFAGRLRPDLSVLGAQLAYAGPFGLAVLVETVQVNLHQYVVAAAFDPATFAVYAVGCLQIPLVEFVASPACNVMMVRMRESLREGRDEAVLRLWHETTGRIALFTFPIVGILILGARELIVTLFTEAYAESVPVFVIASLSLLTAVVQTDGLLRVYADTRRLLLLSLMKLVLIALSISWLLSVFQIRGAVVATLAAAVLGKIAALARARRLLQVRFPTLLPWRALGVTLAAAVAAAVPALILDSWLSLTSIPRLGVLTVAYLASYVALLRIGRLLAGPRGIPAPGV